MKHSMSGAPSRRIARRLGGLLVVAALLPGCTALNPDRLPTPQSLQSGRLIELEVPTAVNLPDVAPVVINGIDSGVVDAITPADGHTTVRIRLKDSAVVATDAEVELRQDTLLGDTYVAISNPSDSGASVVPAGGTLALSQAEDPVQIEPLMVSLSNFLGSGSLIQLGTTFQTLTDQFPADTDEIRGISDVLTDTVGAWADNLGDIDSILGDVTDISDSLQGMKGTLEFALSPAGVDQFRGVSDTTYMVAILAQVGDALEPAMPLAPVLSALTRLVDQSIKPLLIPGWPQNQTSNAELLADVIQERLIPYLKNAPGVNIRSLAIQNEVSDRDLSDQLVKVFRTMGWVR